MCRFQPYDRDQDDWLPPSMRDLLPPGDLANFLIDVVEQLDLGEIDAYYEVREESGRMMAKSERARPPLDPRMMTGLLVYAYCNGTPSSRRIAKLCEWDMGCRVVAENQQPSFRTISEFRRIHWKAPGKLYVRVLQLAVGAGPVKLGHVASDGTKVKANVSKRKAMKRARGLQQFLLRGQEKVGAEWALWCTGQYLLKIWRATPA